MVCLGSVDDTADSAKPVSTLTQTALNLEALVASPTFTGVVTLTNPCVVGTQTTNNLGATSIPADTLAARAAEQMTVDDGLTVTGDSDLRRHHTTTSE